MIPWPTLPITRAHDALIVAQLRPLRRQSGMRLAGPAARAWNLMDAAAEADGVTLWLASSYRTWAQQEYLLRTKGRYSASNPYGAAPPGSSNHQLGRSVDVQTNGNPNHPAILWLRRNAARFGFRADVPTEHWHWTWYGTEPLADGDDMLTDDELIDLIDAAPGKRLIAADLHGPTPLVAHIQRACNLAAVDPPVTVDGIYGPGTAEAVAQLEHRLGWTPDGIVRRPLATRLVKGPLPGTESGRVAELLGKIDAARKALMG